MRKLHQLFIIVSIYILLTNTISNANSNQDNPIHLDYSELLANHGSMMLILDPASGEIIYANHAAAKFYQYSLEELMNKTVMDLNIQSEEEVVNNMSEVLMNEMNHFQVVHRTKEGSLKNMDVVSYPIEFENRHVLFSILFDVTEKVALEKQIALQTEKSQTDAIRNQMVMSLIILISLGILVFLIIAYRRLNFLARHDALTGLINRFELLRRYEDYMEPKHIPLYMLMMDIDHLKFINDTFGHLEGDTVIKMVGNLLKEKVQHQGCVSRVSGDEFVMLVPACSEKRVYEIIDGIENNDLNLKGVNLNVSVGHVKIENLKLTYDEAFSIAESRMYSQKMEHKSSNSKKIENQLMEHVYQKHPDFKQHLKIIREVIEIIGKAVNLNSGDVMALKEAARLQDIGLVLYEDRVRYPKTWDCLQNHSDVKKHPESSFSILNALHKPSHVIDIIIHHHENYDGSGYPKGLKGENIPFLSRILSFANTIGIQLIDIKKNELPISTINERIQSYAGITLDPNLIELLGDYIYIKDLENIDIV